MKNLSSNEYIILLLLLLTASTVICGFGWYNESHKPIETDNKNVDLIKKYDSINIENRILLNTINTKDSIIESNNKKIKELYNYRKNNKIKYEKKKKHINSLKSSIAIANAADSVLRAAGRR